MKTNLLATILATTIIATTSLQAQNHQWTKTFGVSPETTLSRAIAIDPNGNVLTVGTFLGTIDFDPGAGISTLTSTSGASGKDVYISKLDAAGNFLWAKRLGGPDNINFPNSANGLSITTDLSGNVIVGGSFSGEVDINPDLVANVTLTSLGGADGYILKLSPNGDYLWSQQIASTIGDFTNGVTTDATGNIFAIGSFGGTTDFDASAATASVTSIGQADIYILKLTSTGAYSFVKTFGGTVSDIGNAIKVDGAGNIYTTGSFRGTADFDPANATTAYLTSNGGTDVFISKLNSTGSYVWAKSFGSAYTVTGDIGNALTTDEFGNVFVVGTYSASNAATAVDFDPGAAVDNKFIVGNADVFVTKLDAAGNYIFAQTAGSFTKDDVFSIAIDADDNINILGSFSNDIDFDILGLGYLISPVVGSTTTDLFLAKYNAAGGIIGVNTIASGGTDIGYGMVLDGANNFHITGIFSGTADFDATAATTNFSPLGVQDAFTTKWNLCSNIGAIPAAAKTKAKSIGLTNLPTTYASANCEIIARVTPSGASPISGNTTAKVWVEAVQPNGTNSKYVKRHYEITPAANATTATARVTLYFTQQEFNDFNAVSAIDLPVNAMDNTGIANLLIEKRSGTSSNGTGLPNTYPVAGAININPLDTDIFWNEGTKRWEISFNTTGFSGFFIKTQSAILPLKWQAISGDINKLNQATIKWTVNETNVEKYEIEKSNDGYTFGAVQTVSSNGDGENTYSIIDNVKELNTIYYRVKQIDFTGYYTYSSIIKLQPYSTKQVSVYPNPVKGFALISVGDAYLKSVAQLTDVNGKILKTINITSNTFSVDMVALPAGIYFFKINEGKTEKIIKQ